MNMQLLCHVQMRFVRSARYILNTKGDTLSFVYAMPKPYKQRNNVEETV